jgi:hypothetical protein
VYVGDYERSCDELGPACGRIDDAAPEPRDVGIGCHYVQRRLHFDRPGDRARAAGRLCRSVGDRARIRPRVAIPIAIAVAAGVAVRGVFVAAVQHARASVYERTPGIHQDVCDRCGNLVLAREHDARYHPCKHQLEKALHDDLPPKKEPTLTPKRSSTAARRGNDRLCPRLRRWWRARFVRLGAGIGIAGGAISRCMSPRARSFAKLAAVPCSGRAPLSRK